jgi:hypothetical protein
MVMLCQLARHFPPYVAHFLDSCRSLNRRFREETITDLLMANLVMAGQGRVIVEFPDEPSTGADMEWNFVNPDDGTFFRLLLQAKRSYEKKGGWERHTYEQLMHTVGPGGPLQATILCDAASTHPATYPLYIFYHPGLTCDEARRAGSSTIAGVNLASGYAIERLITSATTPKERGENRRLGTIHPLWFQLSALFCPPTLLPPMPVAFAGRMPFQTIIPPTPEIVQQRVLGIANSGLQGSEPLRRVPPVSKEIPDEIQAVIRLREERGPLPSHGLKFWRATFLSSSPRDMETELKRLTLPRG